MKRFFVIGFALVGLLSTSTALAFCPDQDRIDEILELEPITPYVEKILERAQRGINAAADTPTYEQTTLSFIYNWSANAISAMYQLMDGDSAVIDAQRSLNDDTMCLHHDMRILDAMIGKANCALNEAVQNSQPYGVVMLNNVVRFLKARQKNLLIGHNSPLHQDIHYGRVRMFDVSDEEVFCCLPYEHNENPAVCMAVGTTAECNRQGGRAHEDVESCLADGCTQPDDAPEPDEEHPPMCPFSSDYLPPTAYKVGCDLDVLTGASLSAIEPIEKEYEALQALLEARQQIVDRKDRVREMAHTIDTYLGLEPEAPPEDDEEEDEEEHRTFEGCLVDILTIEEDDEDAADKLDTNIVYSTGGTRFAIRGPFSLRKQEIRLMQHLAEQYMTFGQQRSIADYQRRPSDHEPDREKVEEAREQDDIMSQMARGLRLYVRNLTYTWNQAQSERQSRIVAKAIDAPVQMVGVFAPLRKEVANLVRMSSDRDSGLRRFVRGFAWHLRRTCLERPCSDRLETILKLVLSEQCFPYSDGSYKGQDVLRNCKREADL